MELSYRNNEKSLFRKYARLVTSLTKHELFRDYLSYKSFKLPGEVALLLPNGYIQAEGKNAQLKVFPHAIYAPKLYGALAALDLVQMRIQDFSEAQRALAWQLGLIRPMPAVFKGINFATFRPDANPETTSCDGYAGRNNGGSETLAAIRAGAGNDSSDTNTNLSLYTQASTVSNEFAFLYRNLVLFDTSSLGAGFSIASATITVTGNGKTNSIGSPDFHIAASTPASNTAIVNADYNQCQTTTFGNLTYANFPATGATAVITLNASGVSNISKTGVSKFSGQTSWDINNSFTGAWSSGAASNLPSKSADSGATDSWLLTVTATAGATTNAAFLLNFV